MIFRAAALFGLTLLLAACARERVGDPPDGPPPMAPDPALIEQPDPEPEPRSAYGNHSPYEVLGRTYRVLADGDGYRERGIASWYGTKFHGRATSSGEPYDMYRMTAAHRTLPLPTWAEVTRLDTGKRIVVRINDRGPFHADRLIDLSWAAATELDIIDAGTAPVEVRAIAFNEDHGPTARPARVPVLVQVGAFSEQQRALTVAGDLERAGMGPVRTEQARTESGVVWRVRLGPVEEIRQAIDLVEQVARLGLGVARYIYP